MRERAAGADTPQQAEICLRFMGCPGVRRGGGHHFNGQAEVALRARLVVVARHKNAKVPRGSVATSSIVRNISTVRTNLNTNISVIRTTLVRNISAVRMSLVQNISIIRTSSAQKISVQ